MPTYNGERYLSLAIDSVIQQSFDDFELLIVDDGSSDSTEEIVTSYSDNRIVFSRNEHNLGLVGNWNNCMNRARGEYIQFLFQDDILSPEALNLKASMMREHEDMALCFSASFVIDADGHKALKRRPVKNGGVFDGKSFAKRSFRDHNLYGEPSNVMFRKSFARKAGYFDARMPYSPDWEYWIRLSCYGQVGYIDEYLTSFRAAQGSVSSGLLSAEGKAALAEDDRVLIEAVRGIPSLGITDSDVAKHKRSIKTRTLLRRAYYVFRR